MIFRIKKIVIYLQTKIRYYLGSGGDEKSPLFIQKNETSMSKLLSSKKMMNSKQHVTNKKQ